MQARTRPRAGNGLGNIHSQRHHRQAHPKSHPHGILQRHSAEAVESIAIVEKRGDAEIARQIADHFDSPGDDVLAADLDRPDLRRARSLRSAKTVQADVLGRREVIVRKASYAVIATGEKTLDHRQVAEPGHGRGTNFVAQQQVPLRVDVEYPHTLDMQLQKPGVGTERAVRALHLDEEAMLKNRLPQIALGY